MIRVLSLTLVQVKIKATALWVEFPLLLARRVKKLLIMRLRSELLLRDPVSIHIYNS